MLTIEYSDFEERLTIGSLFDQINFSSMTPETDFSGDSFISNEWPIEVLSLDSYYPVEGFRWTKLEKQVIVKLQHLKTKDFIELQCSPDHIVMTNIENLSWEKIVNLKVNNNVVTQRGLCKIVSIEKINDVARLCDMQVAIAHSYFTNDIMSHNSHFLTFLGATALRLGLNVLHYTFELSEAAVGRRYDSNLCDIDSSDVIENKFSILEKYQSMKLGRLIIKEFPPNFATIYTLRSHIERLDVKGFKPDIIIIDYADIMRSSRQYDSLRHELKLVYEELRGFASEKHVGIWTASQSNKDGANAEIVDLGNMSEAYGKAMVADIIVSLSRKAHEKASGFGRLFIAKNRAGRDGIVYPIKIDTSRSVFEIIGGPGNFEEAKNEDEKLTKEALRKKWNELNKDKLVQKSTEPTT